MDDASSKPIAIPNRVRCANLPKEIQPYLDSIDIVSSTPPVHTSGLIGPSVTIGPAASSYRWMDDSESDSCICCGTLFTQTNRRHHCRVCGTLVCGTCSIEQDCPAQLVHEEPTSASKFWSAARSTMSMMKSWTSSSSSSSSSAKVANHVSQKKMIYTLVCKVCKQKLDDQITLDLYRLLESIFQSPLTHVTYLDLRNWKKLETKDTMHSHLVTVFRQSMAHTQHNVTNPWIQTHQNATDLQKKAQALLLWANEPLFQNHYFYTHAWLLQKPIFEQFWPALRDEPSPIKKGEIKLSCQDLCCRVHCNHKPTLEMDMHTIFAKPRVPNITIPTFSEPMALALMPTMLIRGIQDGFYINCIDHFLQLFGPTYAASLYFWIHSIVCTGTYLEQISNLIPPQQLALFQQSFTWGKIMCGAFRRCKGKLKSKEIRRLSKSPNVLLPGSAHIYVETIFIKEIKRTVSNACPYMVPCIPATHRLDKAANKFCSSNTSNLCLMTGFHGANSRVEKRIQNTFKPTTLHRLVHIQAARDCARFQNSV